MTGFHDSNCIFNIVEIIGPYQTDPQAKKKKKTDFQLGILNKNKQYASILFI